MIFSARVGRDVDEQGIDSLRESFRGGHACYLHGLGIRVPHSAVQENSWANRVMLGFQPSRNPGTGRFRVPSVRF